MMPILRCLTLTTLILFGQAAWGFSVSGGSGPADPGLPTEFFFDDLANGWIIGDPGAPIPISYDPAAGPWVKQLSGIINVQPGTTYVIHEHLMVGGGLPWTDWHEEIGTPGWVWSSGSVMFPNGPPVPGLVTSGVGTPLIWFDFAALPAGTMIDIWKEITYVGPAGFSGSITITEFPTVPIPAAAWLLLSALALLGMIRKR